VTVTALDELRTVLAERAVDRLLDRQEVWAWTFCVRRSGKGRASRAYITINRIAMKENSHEEVLLTGRQSEDPRAAGRRPPLAPTSRG
jgi:hypothetical protein